VLVYDLGRSTTENVKRFYTVDGKILLVGGAGELKKVFINEKMFCRKSVGSMLASDIQMRRPLTVSSTWER